MAKSFARIFGYTLSSVQMIDDSFAVAAGFNYNTFPATGVVLISTNGGDSWTERSNGITETLSSAAFLNENEGVACGPYGQVFRTSDGGMNWTTQLSGTDNSLYDLTLTDNGRGFIAGRGGTILISSGVIPVSLSSFTADYINNGIHLHWSTASETNNKGFEIQRCVSNDNKKDLSLPTDWDILGFVNGYGTATDPHHYSFNHENFKQGNYLYRLKQIDFDGSCVFSDIVRVKISPPLKISLDQNYPNPFNPSTIITFSIPDDNTFTTLKIFNSVGQEVGTLIKKILSAGKHIVHFDASGLSSGVYFYVLKADKFISAKKMLFMQ